MAVPGLVDADGRLAVAPNLGWSDVPVGALLVEALDDPPFEIRVENEANLGAVAELVEGAGRGLRDFVYVSGEIGIGAGVVLRGELFRGASGFAGEFGHLTIDPYGPPCGCGGRGCLERLAGQDALLRLAGWDARMRCAGARPEWPGAMLADSAREGHAKTLEALSQVGHTLGIAIASLANLLDPEAVLLGGYLAPITEWLREPIETRARDARPGRPPDALPRAARAPGRRGGRARRGGAEPPDGPGAGRGARPRRHHLGHSDSPTAWRASAVFRKDSYRMSFPSCPAVKTTASGICASTPVERPRAYIWPRATIWSPASISLSTSKAKRSKPSYNSSNDFRTPSGPRYVTRPMSLLSAIHSTSGASRAMIASGPSRL